MCLQDKGFGNLVQTYSGNIPDLYLHNQFQKYNKFLECIQGGMAHHQRLKQLRHNQGRGHESMAIYPDHSD